MNLICCARSAVPNHSSYNAAHNAAHHAAHDASRDCSDDAAYHTAHDSTHHAAHNMCASLATLLTQPHPTQQLVPSTSSMWRENAQLSDEGTRALE